MKAALVAIGIPLFALFWGSALLFAKEKSKWSFVQVFGTRCLVIVVLTHICEALGLFSWMHWGLKHSAVITWISGVVFLVSHCFP